jgi:hypothetical protein
LVIYFSIAGLSIFHVLLVVERVYSLRKDVIVDKLTGFGLVIAIFAVGF